MRRNMSMAWMLVAVAGLALLAAGQATRGRTAVSTPTHVTHAKTPYTAEYTISIVQTLANGNTITRDDTEVKAIDSQGREMTATTTTRQSKDHTPITNVYVIDPVARTITRWNSLDKKATVRAMGAAQAMPGCSTHATEVHGTARAFDGKPTVENLGTESIQGLEAKGTRTTITIPAGAVGNEAPLVNTVERWTALDAGLNRLLVREISDDARSGKQTKELASFERSEPDPSVFQPPAGYEIVQPTKDESTTACATDTAPAK
ncbi:MAG: hypothetical protein WCC32_01390 [Terriglobales bacterium]